MLEAVSFKRSKSNSNSFGVISGSPPETRTSRSSGWAAQYSTALTKSSAESLNWPYLALRHHRQLAAQILESSITTLLLYKRSTPAGGSPGETWGRVAS